MPEIIVVKYFPNDFKQDKGFGFFQVSNEDKETYKIERGLFFHINSVKNKLTEALLEQKLKLKVEIEFDLRKQSYKTKKVIEIIEAVQTNQQNIEINQNNDRNNIRFFIPKNTLDALKTSQITNDEKFLDKNINPALVLGKYSNGRVGDNNKDEKKIRFQEFIEVFKKSDSEIYKTLNQKQNKLKNLYSAKEFECQTSWRLVIGMGTESVYENSMTFHHTYSIPYIPASAIKGAIRSYTILEYFDSDEKTALKDPIFKAIFGDEEHQGNIIFFDTYPTEKPTIELGIMNNHYSEYYRKEAPTTQDNKNPVPLFFISITKGNFRFLFSKNRNTNFNIEGKVSTLSKKFESKKILDIVEELMKKALSEGGIGAKTSSGYGYMAL